MANIKALPKETQEKWLKQRQWQPMERDGITLWKDPDNGVPYIFLVAVTKALEACRLPSDTDIIPDIPLPKRD